MLKRITGRLSFANVVSIVALFVALGGTSYAAIKLPKNSVSSKQLKANSVTSSKVKNGSLLSQDFKAGQLPKGATGSPGAPGATGAKGATGSTGPAGPITGTLPSGVTLRGDYALRVSNSIVGQRMQTAISFGLQLPSAPVAHYIQAGGTVPPQCSGTAANPGASPGNLCVFEFVVNNITAGTQTTFNAAGTDGVADPWGAGIAATATAGDGTTAVDTRVRGTWAVTAP
jgi:hypothetical protein